MTQKWEYALFVSAYKAPKWVVQSIHFMRAKHEEKKFDPPISTLDLICTLGQQGWEMISEQTIEDKTSWQHYSLTIHGGLDIGARPVPEKWRIYGPDTKVEGEGNIIKYLNEKYGNAQIVQAVPYSKNGGTTQLVLFFSVPKITKIRRYHFKRSA